MSPRIQTTASLAILAGTALGLYGPAPVRALPPPANAAARPDDSDREVIHFWEKRTVPKRNELLDAYRGVVGDADGTPRTSAAKSHTHGDPWTEGLAVDARSPEVRLSRKVSGLRLRTRSALINPNFDLQDMARTGLIRVKGKAQDQILGLTLTAPEPLDSGPADEFLITFGMGTGYDSQGRGAVTIELDGRPVEYVSSPYGVHLEARLEAGEHNVRVYVRPRFDGDVFEFRYAMVNRL